MSIKAIDRSDMHGQDVLVLVDGDLRGAHSGVHLIHVAQEMGFELPDEDEDHLLTLQQSLAECRDECGGELVDEVAEKALAYIDKMIAEETLILVRDMGTVMIMDVDHAIREGWIED